MADRSTQEVFDDHLWHRQEQGVEPDLHNYAEDAVILTGYGVFHGHDGVRESARRLHEQLVKGTYHYTTRLVSKDAAFLEWTADSEGGRVEDGVDSFVIRDGHIQVQTIHYRLVHNE